MLATSKLRKCKYYRVAQFENGDVPTASNEFDGFVDFEDYDKLYDEKCNQMPTPEFSLTHEYRDVLDKEKFHSNKARIEELHKTILETQGVKGLEKAKEFVRREMGYYSVDEENLYLALPYQKDEIRLLSSIVKG